LQFGFGTLAMGVLGAEDDRDSEAMAGLAALTDVSTAIRWTKSISENTIFSQDLGSLSGFTQDLRQFTKDTTR
jgi:hypothetical protein